jgi:PAS domain-containing protein
MQISPTLLDTPMAALVGVTGDGRIDWLNGAAARLLGLTAPLGQRGTAWVEDCFGVSLDRLTALSTRREAQMLHLPNGLTLWLRCEWRTPDGHRELHAAHPAPSAPAPAPVAQPATLRETERQTVVRVLAECGGNVSKAARSLGVSRGLIYRNLREPEA